MSVPVLILAATGTNRDKDAAWAVELAGGAPRIAHVNELGSVRLRDHAMLVLPGGFSYGDDLGAGKLWAVALRHRLRDELTEFVEGGRPVLGICNGFQVLVKAGLLPGLSETMAQRQAVTLTRNDSARFECRWVTLAANAASPCVFTQGVEEITCPVAHGEGKVACDEGVLAEIEGRGLVALRYGSGYPQNPNGSANDIAGLCNPAGNVLGLMPHPENHVVPEQHPRFHRGERGGSGLPLFAAGVRYAAQLGGA